MRASGRTVLLPKPNLHKTGEVGGETKKTYKKRSQSPSLSLLHDGVLFSSRLWIEVPSHLEDGFSCYHLNK